MNDAGGPLDPSGARPDVSGEAVAQGVFRVDSDGTLVYVDATAAAILGYAPEGIRGRHFADFFVAEDMLPAQANF